MSNQDFDYQMVRDEARRFLSDAMQPEHLKGLLEQPGSFDRQAWDSAVEFGWSASAAPEHADGLGLGWRGVCVLAEEMGRANASLPLIGSAAVAELLLANPEEAAAAHAADLIAGRRHACLALPVSGDGAPAGAGAASQVALRAGRLHGVTAVTPFAASADLALVSATDADGVLHLVMAALEEQGVTRSLPSSIDNSRAAARLEFDGAPAWPVCAPAQAREQLWNLLSLAALATSFEQLGGAQACLEMACEYARERKAFGQQIGRFQAIKGKLADMYIRIELARGCALDALAAQERGDPSWPGLAAAARVAASDAYDVAARENIQTHGAIGVTWEAMPHHHYRRARALAVEMGNSAAWRERMLAHAGLGF